MTHILHLKKVFLFAVMYFIANGMTYAINPIDWPFDDQYNDSWGPYIAYFYDSDFRNGGVSAHVWHRTADKNGSEVDYPYTEWESRPVAQMTGYQYEDDNGVKHPLYRLCINFWWDEELYDNVAPTHLLFVQGNSNYTANYKYKGCNVYSFGHEDGYEGEPLDYSRITPIEEGKHTVYFAYRSDYYGVSQSSIRWDGSQYDERLGENVLPRVHVWGDNGDVTPYMFNESCKQPSDDDLRYKVAKYNYGYSNFYEYTFYYFGGTPSGIIFHLMYSKANGQDPNTGKTTYGMLDYHTGDLRYEDGAVYYYDGVGVVTEPQMAEFYDPYDIPAYKRTVYFADTDKWIGQNEEYNFFANNIALSTGKNSYSAPYINVDMDYHKYIKINDKWCDVYKLELNGSGYDEMNFSQLKFYRSGMEKKRATTLMDIVDGALYYYAGNGIPTPVMTDFESLLVDEKPGEESHSATIYVNLGANQLMEEDLWEIPYCHPYKRKIGDDISSDYTYMSSLPSPEESERTQEDVEQLEREKMTMIAPGFYSYTIDDITQVDDVTLYYYAEDKRIASTDWVPLYDEDGNPVLDEWGFQEYEEVHTYEYFPNVFVLPASRSPHFDPTEFTRYVFDIGVDCIHQSYLDYEQLKKINDIPLDKQPYLYLAGNETVDMDNSGDDPIRAKAVENDHGCFFTDFEVVEESPAVYKFSTVDVAAAFDALGRDRSTYDYQRGWATYNQGIIGCHIDPTRADYEEWYDKHIVRPDGAPSRMVSIGINQCMDYNSYCQYPWRVEYDPTGEKGVKYPGHYWFVVDFNEDDQTVVLLDFDPHPRLFSRPDNVRQAAIPTTEIAEILHDGKYAEACEHNGKILYEQVNIASGVIEVQGTGNQQILDSGFDVMYTVYTEDGNILFEGKPERISSDYMDLSEDTDLGVQGRFHYTYFDEVLGEDIHKYFRTRYSKSELDLYHIDLAAPEIEYEKKRIYLYMANDGADIALGGAVDFKYSLNNDGSYAYIPDYKVVSAAVDGTEVENAKGILLHKDHFINNNVNPWGNWLGIDADNPWQPHDGFSPLAEQNHWGNYIINSPTGNMPVLLDQLMITDDINLRNKYVSAEIEIMARYPFLSHRKGKLIEVEPLARRAAGNVETVPDDTENYRLVTVSVPTRRSLDFGDEVVTGVDDIVNDNADVDAEPIYYNLSGIRIEAGNLTPGIYIECRGANVRKIVVQ